MSEETVVEPPPSEDAELNILSPEEGDEAENAVVPELEKALAKTSLTRAEGQTKSDVGMDCLSKEDVQKLIDNYKAEINGLEDKLKCLSSDKEALRVAEENKKLKKLNGVLRATNMDFVYKYTTLDSILQDTIKERDDLLAKISALESTAKSGQSQCHPGGDVGAVAQTHPKKEAVAASNSPSVDDLKVYLAQYCTLLQKATVENRQLRQGQEQANKLLANKDTEMRKLLKQLQDVVKERDAAVKKIPHGATHLQETISDQHKHLLVELTHKNRELQDQLKYKDDHIVEQENKIEKLTIRCAEAERNTGMHNSPTASGNEALRKHLGEKETEIREMQKVFAEYEQRHIEMTRELEQLQNNKNPEVFFYNEQLKAFQEDYIAERQEKQRLMEESRRLHEDNQHLRLELQSRSSSQSHFSSPPPSSNASFESLQARTPPVSHAHQQPEYPSHAHGQIPQQVPPPQGPPPNSGYPPNYPPEYRRANTIPPRTDHPGPYYNYPPDPQFYALPMPSYPGETAHEPGPGYQSTYCNPTTPGQRSGRNTNATSLHVRPPQDRHAPR